MQTREINCKSILTRTSGYLKSVCSHSLNPYVGCGFGRSACGVACYVQSNTWLMRGRTWGDFVDIKRNAPEVYRATCETERRWAQRGSRPFSVFFSSATEPWQAAEKKYHITRRILHAMQEHPPDELILQTHTTGIRDDLPTVKALHGQCNLRVHVSVEGDTDRLPGLPPPPASLEERLTLLRELSDEGLRAVACLSPLYPIQDPHAFFERLATCGVHAVVIDHFIEGDGTPDGSRTRKTALPEAMQSLMAESIHLEYRDHIAAIARRYLPVGLSAEGFAGRYSKFDSEQPSVTKVSQS